ncbi:hypothetical protein SALBM311S_04170 [Streptomyces alboniger]
MTVTGADAQTLKNALRSDVKRGTTSLPDHG